MDKKKITLELSEQELKWIRVALDKEGDYISDRGR